MRLSTLKDQPQDLAKFVTGFETDAKAMQKDLMILAIVSNMPYDSIIDMSVDERQALADALKAKSDAEKEAYENAKSKSR